MASNARRMTSPLEPGLLVLQGNRLESLRDVVFEWIARQPLDPLEEEIFIVQSNGAAEWLKINLAVRTGICAAARFELPGRFLWRAYRRMLGREKVVARSGLERDPLTWRLMRLMPALLDRPAFAPVAKFLDDQDPVRRLQLARRVAVLFDQYQVYRGDWLDDWEKGRAVLTTMEGEKRSVPEDQRWQPALWQAIAGELGAVERASARPHVHRAFLDAIAAGREPRTPLPRRAIVFGASHIATQGLEALAALSKRMQVVLAIPNPCRYYWADILDGREALRHLARSRRHQPAKGDLDLSEVPLEAMHLHAHPLLAAWGRQGRDFMRQLDAFDERRHPDQPPVDLFDDDPGTTLLTQAQAAIRDLVPLQEHPPRVVPDADRSIVFHVAHGAQREVEILQDQLLGMLATTPTLRPRDIVVMVPDIETFAPSIRAAFGQYERGDARFIPFDIADLRNRGSNPMVVGIEWLLRVPDQRFRLQEIRDLLEIPAVAARSGIAADALPGLFAWLAGAGVRWGLHESQRASLGLGAAGEQNSWLFGIRRMLLGYASGTAGAFAGVEPYDEIGGLDAEVVGAVIDLFERLERWWLLAAQDAKPSEWGARGRELVATFFQPTDEPERLTVAALENALAAWLTACEGAAFDERVPLALLREAWLAEVDGLEASRRFMTGGVTFCTLIPLRAVPFEVVCLLGMNDGDFPRRQRRDDFDLIGLAGQSRPGDRSRRDDDRYLMLEALLSARRTLYLSWCGRSARDNARQPPSMLVAQLRDYLDAAWAGEGDRSVLADRTVEHPLQPFGRRYFEDGGLPTFAREWRAAHDRSAAPPTAFGPRLELVGTTLDLSQLGRFLRNPVRAFFRVRLDIQVADEPERVDDDEAFELDGLESYQLRRDLLADPGAIAGQAVADGIRARAGRIVRAGSLPMFERGTRIVDEAVALLIPTIERWRACVADYPEAVPKYAVRHEAQGMVVEDWIEDVRSGAGGAARLVLTPSRVLTDGAVRTDRLVDPWVTMLAMSAAGHRATTVLIGCDATLTIAAIDRADAAALLTDLMRAWFEGMSSALPFAARTALAAVGASGDARAAYEGASADTGGDRGDFGLARLYPDFESLAADGRFASYAQRLFEPLVAWVAASVVIEPHAPPHASEQAPSAPVEVDE